MAHSFSLGIGQIWEPLSVMQSPGLYWLTADRQADAKLLCRQIIAAQEENSALALICSGEKIEDLLADLPSPAVRKFPLYSLPDKKSALLHLRSDLMRTLHPENRLLILLAPASLWQSFTNDQLYAWAGDTADWLRQRHCTLVILNHGNGSNKLSGQLSTAHRLLDGLASLQWQQDSAQYLVNWWSTPHSINANQLVKLSNTPQGWQAEEEKDNTSSPTLVISDENRYLAEKRILEGAPPLSANWQLFDNSELLTQQGMQCMAATLIFGLSQTEQVDVLARQVHDLRRQRGNGLKIVVREMSASLRYSDERLLLACGANLIVPHIAPLSSFLTMLEGIQGQRFSRHVSSDIDGLFAGIRPLRSKGYLPLEEFTQAVISLVENTLLPEDGKGVMVALRPVPGLSARQATTLCHQRREGDIMTVVQNRLFLFLSTCRINDLDTALKFVFRLPVREAFSNWVTWHQDTDIISEARRLGQSIATIQPATQTEQKTSTKTTTLVEQAQAEHRQPVPITLLSRTQEEQG
jgi:cellulose biosynthesis protein BcsE